MPNCVHGICLPHENCLFPETGDSKVVTALEQRVVAAAIEWSRLRSNMQIDGGVYHRACVSLHNAVTSLNAVRDIIREASADPDTEKGDKVA